MAGRGARAASGDGAGAPAESLLLESVTDRVLLLLLLLLAGLLFLSVPLSLVAGLASATDTDLRAFILAIVAFKPFPLTDRDVWRVVG